VPDVFGERAAFGGSRGLTLDELRRAIHTLADQPSASGKGVNQ
jgi:hypothetical protein